MSDYPPRDEFDRAPAADGAKYDDRARSPPPPRDSRDRRDDAPRSYGAPAPLTPSRSVALDQIPDPTNVLGVFGLSIRTREQDLDMEFSRAGRVEKVVIVYDQRSGRSRGFGFVTMANIDDAQKAIDDLNGLDLHGRRLRVDFSATTRPHEPTPGEYRGPRRVEDDFRRGPPAYGGRFDDGDRYAGDRWAPPSRDRYDDRRGGYGRDDRYGSSRYGASSYDRRDDDRYASGSSSGRRDRDDFGRAPRDDRDRDYGRSPRRRDSRSPGASSARDRSPVRRDRSPPPPRDDVREDY
ncbi:hypothetical protein JCM3766R1_003652 [Sporobolomyces carnicolor]